MGIIRAPTKLVLDIFRDLGWSVNPDFYGAFGPTYYGDNETIVHQGNFVSNHDYAYGMYVNGDGNHIIHSGVLETRGDFANALYIYGGSYRLDITGVLQSTGDYSQALNVYGNTGVINHRGTIAADGLDSVGILLSARKGASVLHSGSTTAGDGLAAIRFNNPYPEEGYRNSLHILDGSFIQGDIVNTDAMQEAIISFGYAVDPDGALTGVDPGFRFSFEDDIIGRWDGFLGAGVTSFNGNTTFRLLTVRKPAILRGAGIISGAVTNEGCVSPGNSIGTLTIDGDYTQFADGQLLVEISGTDNHDLLKISGAANLDGTLNTFFQAPNSPRHGDQYTILTAREVKGQFAEYVDNLTPTLVLDSRYTDTDVIVEPRRDYANNRLWQRLTERQQAVAAALGTGAGNASGDFDQVLHQIDALTDYGQVARVLGELTPKSVDAFSRTTQTASRLQAANLVSRLSAVRAGRQTEDDFGDRLQLAGLENDYYSLGLHNYHHGKDLGLFLNAKIASGKQDGSENQTGYGLTTTVFNCGADKDFGRGLTLGTFAGFTSTDAKMHDAGSKSGIRGGSLGAYGTYQEGGFYLDGIFSCGFNQYDNTRAIALPAETRRADSGPSGRELSLYNGIGYSYQFGGFQIEPMASLQYVNNRIDAYTESGADSLNLAVAAQRIEFLQAGVGLRLRTTFDTAWCKLQPQLGAIYYNRFGNDGNLITSRFAQGQASAFTIEAAESADDFVSVAAGITATLSNRMEMKLDYGVVVGQSDYSGHSISLEVGIAF